MSALLSATQCARIAISLFAPDFLSLSSLVFLQTFTRAVSSVLLLGSLHVEALPSVPDASNVNFALLSQLSTYVGLSLPVLRKCGPGLFLTVLGDATVSLSLLLQILSWIGFVSSVVGISRAGVITSPSGMTVIGALLPSRILSQVDAALLSSGCMPAGNTLPALGFAHIESSLFLRQFSRVVSSPSALGIS
jgi:hypothetical protein